MSYGVFVKATENAPIDLLEKYEIPTSPIIYRGSESHQDVAKRFVNEVTEIARRVQDLLKTNKPIIMTEEEQIAHVSKSTCNLCACNFSIKNQKVADHCHLSGKFRQTLCNTCNLKLQKPNFVPCFLHNLSNYDAHFIVTELGNDTKSISVIPNSEEKYISFSKHVTNNFSIRFIDSCRFMASKLSTLAENLLTPGFEKFRETAKSFVPKDMDLVTRKGVYPYEFTDSWDKLEETILPRKEDFYSTLTEEHIDDEEYEHAVTVWNHFKCKTLGEYSDLYLKIDVLLLADVFENFRDMCISTYNLDPVYYFTAPGFSFDCMLKYTKVKLELLSDFDTHLFFENSIRGGLTQASMRYAKANNEKIQDY
ncbi:DNA pol B 2 domain-containing protein, partial [Aphis craccivora]